MKGNLPGAQISLSPLESWNPGSVRVQEPGFPPQRTAYLCPVGPTCRGSPNVGAPVPEPLPHAGPCLEHPSWLPFAWKPCAQSCSIIQTRHQLDFEALWDSGLLACFTLVPPVAEHADLIN